MLNRCITSLLLAFLLFGASSMTLQAKETPRVDIYLTSWCPYCKQAVAFFRDRQIPVHIYNIEKDKLAGRRKQQLDPRKGVPLVVVNDQVIYGFSPRSYSIALEE